MEVAGSEAQSLRIERSEIGDPSTPTDHDLLLNVSVRVGGYSAADQAWIVSTDWQGFVRELRHLEATRQGEAVLQGASPEELRLVFAATDNAGHVAVSGHIGWHRPDGFLQKLHFGFPFDPGFLRNMLNELATFTA